MITTPAGGAARIHVKQLRLVCGKLAQPQTLNEKLNNLSQKRLKRDFAPSPGKSLKSDRNLHGSHSSVSFESLWNQALLSQIVFWEGESSTSLVAWKQFSNVFPCAVSRCENNGNLIQDKLKTTEEKQETIQKPKEQGKG